MYNDNLAGFADESFRIFEFNQFLQIRISLQRVYVQDNVFLPNVCSHKDAKNTSQILAIDTLFYTLGCEARS